MMAHRQHLRSLRSAINYLLRRSLRYPRQMSQSLLQKIRLFLSQKRLYLRKK